MIAEQWTSILLKPGYFECHTHRLNWELMLLNYFKHESVKGFVC